MIPRAAFLAASLLLTWGVSLLLAMHWEGIPALAAGAVLLRAVQHIPEVHPPRPRWVDTRGVKS